jgi:hypothetical protein
MKAGISEPEFYALVAQSGLPLSPEQKQDLFEIFGFIEQQVARVHAPLPREAEPALIFRCGEK